MTRLTATTEPEGWPEDAVYDDLVGHWGLYQRTNGHKTSTDDVLTAWLAAQSVNNQPVERYLDLGCGIGSVLLMTCHALRPKYALGIEVQKQSALMAQASIDKLPGKNNIDVLQSDFRSLHAEPPLPPFDLVTGSPPYFPVGAGTLSKDYQRAACRFELNGGVEAYCKAAKPLMAPRGKLVLVFQTLWSQRVQDAAHSVGLHLQQQVDVLMRTDRKQPFLSVYVFGHECAQIKRMNFAIRDAQGNITAEYRKARSEIGLKTSR